jgi:hypothetical protein
MSVTHFFVKLVLAAPASFFSIADMSQDACASFSHFVMKLVIAAPANFFSVACALHEAVCAKAVLAQMHMTAAKSVDFMSLSPRANARMFPAGMASYSATGTR